MTTYQPEDDGRLSAYLDGDLDPAAREQLELELESDERLRRNLEDLRLTVSALRTLPELTPARSFRLDESALGRASRPNVVSLPERRARRRHATFWLRAAASLAAVIAVALISVDTLQRLNSGAVVPVSEPLSSRSAPAAAPAPSTATDLRGASPASTAPVQKAPLASQESSKSAATGPTSTAPPPAPAADASGRSQQSGGPPAPPATAKQSPPAATTAPSLPLRAAAALSLVAAGLLAGLGILVDRRRP